MALNVNEILIERVRSLVFTDYQTGDVIGRLTSLEEPSLNVTSEADNITDAIGALISTMYKAKTAKFSATNSLFSTDLYALQSGSKKKVASELLKIEVPIEETLEVVDGKITLSQTPLGEITTIYSMENGDISKKYRKAAADVTATEFSINGKKITVPTEITNGKMYVKYTYETVNAIELSENSNAFPEVVGCEINTIFRNKCNEMSYAGVIYAKKAKLDGTSRDLALTSTGKHSFSVDFLKDYCADDDDLFKIVIPGETLVK